ncbi:MAG: Gfo/Idh/MocA family oxidoreductase [Candidatus Thorarchaeota archaeon]
MNNKFNVLQVGLGPMGKIVADLLIKRKNIDLKAVIDIDKSLKGKLLSEILNAKDTNLKVESNLAEILSQMDIDLVFIATSSSLEKIVPIIKQALNSGCNVLSICEELSYPYKNYPTISQELNNLALTKNLTIVGTGINPGYLMDLLPIVLTAPCQQVHSIKITRMINSAKRRESFQRKIGTGLKVEEFYEKINNNEITGHVGLSQSIQMIAAALGIPYDTLDEFPPKPIITSKEFVTSYGETVHKGNVCGLNSKAIAKKDKKEIFVLDFVAYAGEHEEYDSVKVDGIPSLHQKIVGGVHGDIGTAAIVANLIPIVINAKPGLLTMKDLPVPCYTENKLKN